MKSLTLRNVLSWSRVPFGDRTTILVTHCNTAQRYVIVHRKGGVQRPQGVRCGVCKKTWGTVPADEPIRALKGIDHVYKLNSDHTVRSKK